MKRGDIYLVSLDPTSGHEQRGRRPILIISPEEFNKKTGLPIVLPITSGGRFAKTIGFAVSLEEAGTRTTGVIRCDQLRVLDLTARGAVKLESVPEDVVSEVLARITPIFQG
jgi:mRNA-degrading endonuclease toxin of MazEF toxin-antitoxin module